MHLHLTLQRAREKFLFDNDLADLIEVVGHNPENLVSIGTIAEIVGAEVAWIAAGHLDWEPPQVLERLFPPMCNALKRVAEFGGESAQEIVEELWGWTEGKPVNTIQIRNICKKVLASGETICLSKESSWLAIWNAVHIFDPVKIERGVGHMAMTAAYEVAKAASYKERERLSQHYSTRTAELSPRRRFEWRKGGLITEASLNKERQERLEQALDLMSA